MNTRSLVCCFLVGAAAGGAMPRAGGDAARPTSPSTPPPAPSVGQEPTLSVELKLESIRNRAGGEAPELAVRLANRLGDKARVATVYEVRDGSGRLAASRARPRQFDLAADAEIEFSLSAGELPDGLYRAAVIAAARTSETHAVAQPELYFESKGGAVIPLDFAAFAERSDYNVGVTR